MVPVSTAAVVGVVVAVVVSGGGDVTGIAVVVAVVVVAEPALVGVVGMEEGSCRIPEDDPVPVYC